MSKVSSINESASITLDVVLSVSILNIFLLIGVSVFVAKEKGFFRACEMTFEDFERFTTSVVFFVASSDSIDSLPLLPPSPRSTTCNWGLLGRSNVALIDGIRLLWGERENVTTPSFNSAAFFFSASIGVPITVREPS